ncbi:hypothetical protein C8J42_10954 [Sphingomonas sp. PP-CE-1A-559]|uniref:hypothetical protein n=1 Tax=Sphingomonas sp. PP-CE-1A-559 TaxID=2135657 RepID=UPI001056BB52|nr:hypothetical protein [Sphingomonas sp. PP-CE-1A-559]TCP87593.1 hypothetical protein C8J42_10954 [Sphingomonas sp. PP-CE-1A-559]
MRRMNMPTMTGTVLVGLAVAWWSFAVTAKQVLDPVRPSIGLLGMTSSQAQAGAASNLVASVTGKAEREKARRLAATALDREPGNATAARAMAFVAAAEGRQASFKAWLNYAESLSRRDTITQLALLEITAAASDMAGTLRHYNRTMLVNVGLRDTLVPILVSATSDPEAVRGLVPFLQNRPAWWPQFVGALNARSTSPSTIPIILQSLRLDTTNQSEASALGDGLSRMLNLGDREGAFAFYRKIRKAPVSLLRDGSFEQGNSFGPFEWAIHEEGSSAASRQERADGRGLALFVASGDSDTTVAEQVLVLKPGDYSLSALIVPDAESSPPMSIRVRCQASGAELTKLSSMAPSSGRIEHARFHISEQCQLARIMISVDGASGGQAAGWIDDIAITRL